MGRNYTLSDARTRTIDTIRTHKAENARKTVKEINAKQCSQFQDDLMACTLEIYKSSNRYYVQTCSSLTSPMVDILSGDVALRQQRIEAFRQSVIALRHNLKFVLAANKINSEMSVKENNAKKTVFVNLDYLKSTRYTVSSDFRSYNKIKTIRQELTVNKDSMNSVVIQIINTSINNVEHLFKYIDKPTKEIVEVKDKAIASAQNIIAYLNDKSIDLGNLYTEMQNYHTTLTK